MKKFSLFTSILLLVTVVFTLLLGACAEPAPEPAPAPTPAPEPAPADNAVAVSEWVLPTLAVQTGPIAFAGIPFHWSSDYAANKINAEGGIRGVPLKLVHYDSAFPDTAKTAAAAAKAIPGALMLNGPMIYPEVAAISQLIMDAKIANINAATLPSTLDPIAPYGIGQIQSYPKGAVLCGSKWLELNPDIKIVAALYDATQPEVVQAAQDIKTEFVKVGVDVVLVEAVGADQFDFGATVLKGFQANADAFFSFMLDSQTAAIAKEIYNRGMTDGRKFISCYPSNGPAIFSTGKGFMENSYLWDNFNVVDPNPDYQKYSAAHAEEFNGQVPGSASICGVDAVYAFKIAVETLELTGDPAKLAEERQQIADFLYNSGDLPGVFGTYTYHNVRGEKIAPYFLQQIKNNAFEYVATIENK